MTRVRQMDNKMRYFSGSFEWLFRNHSVYMTILHPCISYRMSHVLNDVVDCRLLLILMLLIDSSIAVKSGIRAATIDRRHRVSLR